MDKRPYVIALSRTRRTNHAWREGNKNMVCGVKFVEAHSDYPFEVDAEEGNCSMCNRIVKLRRVMGHGVY